MPSLMLRKLDPALVARVKAYARAKEISLTDAAVHLLAAGLDHLEARAAGAQATNRSRTAAERSAAGRKAVTARWDRVRSESC